MPEISKITLPSGTTYDIKDAEARSQISALTGGDAVVFVGVSSVKLTDGGTETPKVGNETKTPAAGQLFFYGTQEFIWGQDSKWHALGSLDSLGDLAYKDNATGSYTPAGTVSQPTFTGTSADAVFTISQDSEGNYQPTGTVSAPKFTGKTTSISGTVVPNGSVTVSVKSSSTVTPTVSPAASGAATYTPGGTVSAPAISVKTAGATTTIKNPTSSTVAKTVVAAAPGATAPANNLTYYSVTDETLSLYQLGYTTGASITTSNVTVKTGDAAYEAAAPEFTGTGVCLKTSTINIPAQYNAGFTGSVSTVSGTCTPIGEVAAPTFTGDKAQISATVTATGTVSKPTFTGTAADITVS